MKTIKKNPTNSPRLKMIDNQPHNSKANFKASTLLLLRWSDNQ